MFINSIVPGQRGRGIEEIIRRYLVIISTSSNIVTKMANRMPPVIIDTGTG